MNTTFVLEGTVHFVIEKRIELYEKYCLRVSQMKNVLGAKNAFQSQGLLELERRGA